MKKIFGLSIIFLMFLCGNMLHAQYFDDDDPYLTDDDIAAVEMILPEDTPEIFLGVEPVIATEPSKNIEANEMSRLNTSQKIYHLLILDRTHSPLNSDISGIHNRDIIYKFRHGRNGYLILIYTSPQEGPVFPTLPDRSRIMVNIMSVRKNTLTEYVNSTAFRRYVTNRRITTDILRALRN